MSLGVYGVAIDVIPPAEVIAAKYDAVAARCEDTQPVHDDILRYLENAERRHFALMHGRYHMTGRLEHSLTSRGAYGAIRESTPDKLAFGSRVFYAHFLTKSPYDAENFQVTKRGGEGRSAVLVFPPSTKGAITKRLMRHLTEPW